MFVVGLLHDCFDSWRQFLPNKLSSCCALVSKLKGLFDRQTRGVLVKLINVSEGILDVKLVGLLKTQEIGVISG